MSDLDGDRTREREQHVVGSRGDFPAGTHRIVRVGRREIGIFNIGGRLYGLPNRCPHQGGPLCATKRITGTLACSAETNWRFEWVLDGEVIACPWHGQEFHVPTGLRLAAPQFRLRTYTVTVRDGLVFVEL
jgi:nitrite reductase (NADH) small subunit